MIFIELIIHWPWPYVINAAFGFRRPLGGRARIVYGSCAIPFAFIRFFGDFPVGGAGNRINGNFGKIRVSSRGQVF